MYGRWMRNVLAYIEVAALVLLISSLIAGNVGVLYYCAILDACKFP